MAILDILTLPDPGLKKISEPVVDFDEGLRLVMATQRGVIKKSNLSIFKNINKGGIIAIYIDEGDLLLGVEITDGNNNVLLATRQGMSIRFPESQLRDQGRATRGVRGIKLSED